MRHYRIKEEKYPQESTFSPQFRDIYGFWGRVEILMGISTWNYIMNIHNQRTIFNTKKAAQNQIDQDTKEQKNITPKISYHRYYPKINNKDAYIK
jgi:hypothetical protein